MNVIQDKTDSELFQSLLAEIAKTTNEIRCAQSDLQKAQSRMSFAIAVVNELLKRDGSSFQRRSIDETK